MSAGPPWHESARIAPKRSAENETADDCGRQHRRSQRKSNSTPKSSSNPSVVRGRRPLTMVSSARSSLIGTCPISSIGWQFPDALKLIERNTLTSSMKSPSNKSNFGQNDAFAKLAETFELCRLRVTELQAPGRGDPPRSMRTDGHLHGPAVIAGLDDACLRNTSPPTASRAPRPNTDAPGAGIYFEMLVGFLQLANRQA